MDVSVFLEGQLSNAMLIEWMKLDVSTLKCRSFADMCHTGKLYVHGRVRYPLLEGVP